MADAAYFHKQAEKCLMLARGTDDLTANALIELAEEFTTKARELDGQGQR